MRRFVKRRPADSGEFLWLTSLSDLMILLFILFVVLFSFTYKKLKESDLRKIVSTLTNRPQPKNPMVEIKNQLDQWVAKEKLADQIEIKEAEDMVTVEIKDQVLFPSAEFDLSSLGLGRVKSLAAVLEKIPPRLKLGIEGHTDDVPIHTATISDNWDLSAKRALSVLRALNLSDSLLKRTQVIAFGEMKPLLPNRNPAGLPVPTHQARNRRVTLRVF